MIESLGDGKRVEIAPALLSVFQDAAQVMSGDFNSEGIRDHVSRLLLMFSPRRKSERNPYRTPIDEELHIHGIGMASCDCHHDALINTANRPASPTLNCTEVLIHIYETKRRPATFLPSVEHQFNHVKALQNNKGQPEILLKPLTTISMPEGLSFAGRQAGVSRSDCRDTPFLYGRVFIACSSMECCGSRTPPKKWVLRR